LNPDDSIAIILDEYKEARLLYSRKEYLKLQKYMEENSNDTELINDIKLKLEPHKVLLDKMMYRCEEVDNAIRGANTNEDNWILGSQHFGVNTHYKVDDDGLISIRMEGIQENLPLYEQICVIYEVALYSKWVPFMNISKLLYELGTSCIQY
jgi:hypothetical protein